MANNGQPVIVARSLTRRFGDKRAVDHLALEVNPGEVFGFLGHNGAGKTTTVRLLNGVLAPTEGTAQVLGLSTVSDGPALRRQTGVLTETPSLDDRLTGREGLHIYADLFGVPEAEVAGRVKELLAAFELEERADEKVGGYSKGMKQRLALARALLHRPAVLFLDEPTAGLDPIAAHHVHDMIMRLSRDEGRTVFLCTHNLVEAQQLCDRVAVLEHGRLLALGTPAELAQQVGYGAGIEVEMAPATAPAARDILAKAPGVKRVSWLDSVATVEGAEREAVPDLLARLVGAGVRVYRVTPRQVSLEDVYFALHGEKETQA